MKRFKDRSEAGKQLAARLVQYIAQPGLLVLALPGGGLPVAVEVASALKAQIDVFLVRKLGVPGKEQVALGAIATGARVLNKQVMASSGTSLEVLERIANREYRELERLDKFFRNDQPALPIAGRPVILVDDGLTPGAVLWAAVAALRQLGPARLVVGLPVAQPVTCNLFRDLADEVVCGVDPGLMDAGGLWYEQTAAVSEEQARHMLRQARLPKEPPPRAARRSSLF